MLNNQVKEEISIETPSRIGTLIAIFLFIAAVSVYAFYTRGVAAELDVVRADIVTKSSEVGELVSKVESFKKAERDFNVSTEVTQEESIKSVPVGVNQDEVIENLVDIANESDISLKSLSFGQGTLPLNEGVFVLRVNASFEGNYADLIGFLQRVERNKRLFRVNSITVQINTIEVIDLKRVTFSLSMEAFYQNESK